MREFCIIPLGRLALCLTPSECSAQSVVICHGTVPCTSCFQRTPAASKPKSMPPRPLRVCGGTEPRGTSLPPGGSPAATRSPWERMSSIPTQHEPGPQLRGKPGGSSRERASAEASEPPGSWRELRWVRRAGDHAPVPALPAPAASRSPFPPWPLAPAAPPAIALQLPAFQASAGAAAASRPDDATGGGGRE